ncbi:MAG: GAF domain-containing protein [Anaerolineae bacterium]|nr:GAF domain-containing protein [Anaerolineae bacterium]
MKFRSWPGWVKRLSKTVSLPQAIAAAAPREHEVMTRLMETSPAGITLVDRQGRITFANQRAESVLGLTRDQITSRTYNAPVWHITDYEGRPFPDEQLPFARVMATKQPVYDVRHAIQWPDGRRGLLSINGAPLFDEKGEVEQVVMTIADVTEQVLIEKALHIQRDLVLALSSTDNLTEAFNQFLETTLQIEGVDCGGVYLVDRQTGMLNLVSAKGLSAQFVKHTSHYQADAPQFRLAMTGEPVYTNYAKFLPNQDQAPPQEGLRALAIIPVQYEGKMVAVLNLASHTFDEIPLSARKAFEIMAAQIGGAVAHVRTEAALRESQENLQTLFDTLDDFLFILDKQGRILHVNPVVETRLGYPAEELAGTNLLAIHPEAQREEAATIIADMLAGKITFCSIPLQAKNGALIPVETKVTYGKWSGRDVLFGISRDITERKQAEETFRQRNRELALLNQAGRALSSTLALDQVLKTVLEEVHRLPDVLACSIWLIDPETRELVCREVTDPKSQIVRGWRLTPGQGLAGWAVQHKQSLNVPDVLTDERYFKGVDEKTGLNLRSVLTVPLQVKQRVIGVMQVVNETPHRFDENYQTLLESLASTAAIAIQNAQLYEQARQDADTKLALFHEVNHRVKNNLTAIIGLLYAERHHATLEGRTLQDIINTLVNRVQGLSTVHELLSAAEWRPLPLSDLALQIINAALHILSSVQRVVVDVQPSPVEVSPTQANHLALVINELATNSMKYALSEQDRAKITVRIRQNENTVHFEFRDNGPGFPEDVLKLERSNVGLYLIETIVRNSLNGELTLRNEHGAVTIIRFNVMP